MCNPFVMSLHKHYPPACLVALLYCTFSLHSQSFVTISNGPQVPKLIAL